MNEPTARRLAALTVWSAGEWQDALNAIGNCPHLDQFIQTALDAGVGPRTLVDLHYAALSHDHQTA